MWRTSSGNSCASQAIAPSSGDKSKEFRTHRPIYETHVYCGCPYDLKFPVPIVLMHEAFNQFMADSKYYEPKEEDAEGTTLLFEG